MGERTSLEARDRRRDLDSSGQEVGQRWKGREEEQAEGGRSAKEQELLPVDGHGSSDYLNVQRIVESVCARCPGCSWSCSRDLVKFDRSMLVIPLGWPGTPDN